MNDYYFLLESTKQGLFWDTIYSDSQIHDIHFYIKNNTPDTITIRRVGIGDGKIYYIGGGSENSIIFPDSLLKIWVRPYHLERMFYDARNSSRIGYAPFNSSCKFEYYRNDTIVKGSVSSWGILKVGKDSLNVKNYSDSKSNNTSLSEPKNNQIILQKKDTAIVRIPFFVKNYPPLIQEKKHIVYNGEYVNHTNRKNFKVGKWIVLNDTNQLVRIEYYSGRDLHWDSAYFVNVEFNRYARKIIHVQLSDTSIKEQLFNDQGVLYRSYLWNGDSIREPEKKIYYETGNLQRVFYPYPDKQIVDYYPEGGIQKITSYNYNGNIETIKQFYPSGQLQYSEQPRRRITYDETGRLISEVESYSGATTSYVYYYDDDSVLCRDRLYNRKHILTEKGEFKDNILWTGIRRQVDQPAEFEGKVYLNGKENGEMYKGEWINHSDSAGYQGKRITFDWQSKAIVSMATYLDGYTDSIVSYYESGEVLSIRYPQFCKKSICKSYFYYKSGPLKKQLGGFDGDTVFVSFYESGRRYQLEIRDGVIYTYNDDTDTCTYKITYNLNRQFSNGESRSVVVEEYFEDCKLVKRVGPKYHSETSIDLEESQKRKYKVEEGYFKDGDLYAGYRMYYLYNHVLLEKKRIEKGAEVKTIYSQPYNSNTVISEIDTNLLAPRDAYFNGGDSTLYAFINKNFNQDLINRVGVSGIIYAEIVIDETGKVSGCVIKKSLSQELDNELKRVLFLLPEWVPGVCNPEYLLTDPYENPNYRSGYVYCKTRFIIVFKIN